MNKIKRFVLVFLLIFSTIIFVGADSSNGVELHAYELYNYNENTREHTVEVFSDLSSCNTKNYKVARYIDNYDEFIDICNKYYLDISKCEKYNDEKFYLNNSLVVVEYNMSSSQIHPEIINGKLTKDGFIMNIRSSSKRLVSYDTKRWIFMLDISKEEVAKYKNSIEIIEKNTTIKFTHNLIIE